METMYTIDHKEVDFDIVVGLGFLHNGMSHIAEYSLFHRFKTTLISGSQCLLSLYLFDLTMKSKRQTTSESEEEEDERDMLNELPEGVILHIMKFMDAKHAVQTCVLSKRWKELWKHLTTLSFSHEFHRTVISYNKFVPRVLSNRNSSLSLQNLDIWAFDLQSPNLLDFVTQYALLHSVEHLAVTINIVSHHFFSLIFSSLTLTYLKLCITSLAPTLELPCFLRLPSLKSLHLDNVCFTASVNGCADPFSSCGSLDSLVIENCFLHNDAKVLWVSNSNLCSLTLGNTILKGPDKIQLSTPNLRFLSVVCDPVPQLSLRSFSFLEQVYIDVQIKTYFHTYYVEKSYSALVSLLQVIADYVKILILSSSTIEILNGLLTSDSKITQLPCFAQLKSLKLKGRSSSKMSEKEVSRIVEYLLPKSSVAKVVVTNC
ncbi:hypothetical protein VNO78_21202 [Psophocarpus tetragonolobus]|uniref:F-box domain-containing protein n=1 Tax=Psophocarpus tetragonolobus TaxID=3891 RepID=A0AAN9XHU3_PSOTE